MISLKRQIRLKEDEITEKKQIIKVEIDHIKETFHKALTSPITLLTVFVASYCVSAKVLRKTYAKAQPEAQQPPSPQKSVEKAAVSSQPKLKFSHALTFMSFIVDVALLAQRLLK